VPRDPEQSEYGLVLPSGTGCRYAGPPLRFGEFGMIPLKAFATYDDFARLDIRIGRIVEVQPFPRARNPSL
jgi:hypothetical protein